MAAQTFVNKPAAGTYSVNTGHAYCPDYVWLLDEGTGNPQDKGKAGAGATLTLNGGIAWSTLDLGGGNGIGGETTSPILTFDGASGTYANGSGISFSSSICIATIFKTNDATPTATESLAGVGDGTVTTKYVINSIDSSGNWRAAAANTQIGTITDLQSTTAWHDANLHMCMTVLNQTNGTTCHVYYQVDRGAISGSPTSGTTDDTEWGDMTQVRLGSQPGSGTSTNRFNGTIVSVFIWKDNFASWDTTFFQSIFDNPWQFLSATTKYLKMLVHPSAIGQVITEGIVLAESTSSPLTITGAKIGEIIGGSPQYAFYDGDSDSPQVDPGYAVIKIPVADFGGGSLTTSSTPLAVVRNATYTTGLVSCTVVEE